MDLETALCREHLITCATSVVLHTCVGLYVGRQRAFHGERTETLRALVGFLMSVNPDVPNQITRFLELFTTICTLMPSHTIHLEKSIIFLHVKNEHWCVCN